MIVPALPAAVLGADSSMMTGEINESEGVEAQSQLGALASRLGPT